MCGVVLGLSILCRSEAVVVSALFLMGLGVFTQGPAAKRLGRIGLVGALAAVVVAPWVARNYLAIGTPALTTEGGFTLYLGNNPQATGGYFMPEQVLMDLPSGEAERDAFFKSAAADYMVKNPARAPLLVKKQPEPLGSPQQLGSRRSGSRTRSSCRGRPRLGVLAEEPMAARLLSGGADPGNAND